VELGELIAEGSFGAVYQATQPSVGREVAVKVVRADLADDPEFIRRFEAEAQIVARLEHPHIVPLYDYWREPGGAYLVMRYVRGGTGEQALHRGEAGLDLAANLRLREPLPKSIHATRQGPLRDVEVHAAAARSVRILVECDVPARGPGLVDTGQGESSQTEDGGGRDLMVRDMNRNASLLANL